MVSGGVLCGFRVLGRHRCLVSDEHLEGTRFELFLTYEVVGSEGGISGRLEY